MLAFTEFRANATATLDRVARGETVRILRHGRPVADLVPVRAGVPQKLPSWKQAIRPLKVARPDGQTVAQRIIAERDVGR